MAAPRSRRVQQESPSSARSRRAVPPGSPWQKLPPAPEWRSQAAPEEIVAAAIPGGPVQASRPLRPIARRRRRSRGRPLLPPRTGYRVALPWQPIVNAPLHCTELFSEAVALFGEAANPVVQAPHFPVDAHGPYGDPVRPLPVGVRQCHCSAASATSNAARRSGYAPKRRR